MNENREVDEQELKLRLKKTFDSVSEGYDNPALRFFTDSAGRFPGYLDLKGDEHLLDVGTGTGNAAIAISGALPRGRVTGIDFSEGMLARARAKVAERGIRNIDFVSMDMQSLDFPDGAFDAAVLPFSIFFVEDMEGLLRHVAEKVRPGGRILTSSFYGGTFSPQVDMFFEGIKRYGVERPQALFRFSTTGECASLFERAGLSDVSVDMVDLGYHLHDAGQWWDIVWNAGLRRFVAGLAPLELAEFKEGHLSEVQALSTGDGVWLEVKVLYAMGTR